MSTSAKIWNWLLIPYLVSLVFLPTSMVTPSLLASKTFCCEGFPSVIFGNLSVFLWFGCRLMKWGQGRRICASVVSPDMKFSRYWTWLCHRSVSSNISPIPKSWLYRQASKPARWGEDDSRRIGITYLWSFSYRQVFTKADNSRYDSLFVNKSRFSQTRLVWLPTLMPALLITWEERYGGGGIQVRR